MLSIGGRIVLLKSVLTSLPMYTLAATNTPKGILAKLEQIFADFLWGFDEGGTKHHWISWSSLCHPLKEEGIGLRKLCEIYSTFSAKLWWKVLTEETLWSNFMKAKYCTRESLENVQPKATDSLTWKRIMAIRSSIEDNILKEDEHYYWTASMDGKFSTSSAYDIIREEGTPTMEGEYIWHKGMPAKISFFMLRLLKKRLPLDEALRRLHIQGPSKCHCCSSPSEETIDHLFLRGQWAQKLWQYFGTQMGISGNPPRHRDMVRRWWQKGGNPATKVLLQSIPSLISWAIWKMRCSAKYDGTTPCFHLINFDIIDTACFILQESMALYITTRNWHEVVSSAESFTRPRVVTMVSWIKPITGHLKLNTDGASRGNPGRGGGGGILRDQSGNCRLAFAEPYEITTSVEAEGQAMLKGLQLCTTLIGNTPILVEGDSKLLIDILNNKAQTPWRLRNIIPAILGFTSVRQFQHCYRQANQAADHMANLGCELNELKVFQSQASLPQEVRGIITLDKTSLPSLRTRPR